MQAILAALATITGNWPVYLLTITALAGILGVFGSGFTAVGNLALKSSLAPLRAIGHTLVLIGGLLTGVYSHWGQVAAAVTKFVTALAGVLPKGPGGAATATGVPGSIRGTVPSDYRAPMSWRLPRLVLLALLVAGCAALNALTPVQKQKLASEGVDAALRYCDDWVNDGAGGQSNERLRLSCLALKTAQGITTVEDPPPSSSLSPAEGSGHGSIAPETDGGAQ